MKNDIHDLGLVLDSRVKLVVIESWDEPRVLEVLTGLAVKRRVLPLAPIPVAQPLRPSGRFLTIHAMGRRPEICAFFIR